MQTDARRVLLISMPYVDLTDPKAQQQLFDQRAVVNLPYGLLCICTYVRSYASRDVDVRIIDVNDALTTEYQNGNHIADLPRFLGDYIERQVREYEPHVVGLSVMFSAGYQFLDEITARIRRARPEAILLVGGNLATAIHEEIASRPDIDAVVFGEGEEAVLGLVNSDDLRSHISENSAFVTRESMAAGVKPENPYLADLDRIPPIDFSAVNLLNFNLPRLRGVLYQPQLGPASVSRVMYTSRGCPYNCNFCAGSNVHGKKVRFQSAGRVIADVKAMIEKDGLTDLFIGDDSFLIDRTRAKTILRELVRLKIHVSIQSMLMRNIDDEIAELTAQLGNTFQYTSLESGSDHVLKHVIQKPITKPEAKRAVDSLRKFGMSVLTNIVIGSPGETDEHRQETLETLQDIGFNWVFFMIAMPVPGSRLYKECKEKGYIVNDKFNTRLFSICNIRTPEYAPEHVERQAYMMNLYTNFVHNYDLRMGNYDAAITNFNCILKSFPDHAFAYYGLMKSFEGKGDAGLAGGNRTKFESIVSGNTFWRDWAFFFNL